jgi:tetratricopeptide (TPR) repeat protein
MVLLVVTGFLFGQIGLFPFFFGISLGCAGIRIGWKDIRSARAKNMGLTLNELDSLAINDRGVKCRARGDIKGAIKNYDRAISLNPGLASAFSNRANARIEQGELESALNDYNEAIRLQPDGADTYYNRASLWEEKGNPACAIADFQKYLDLGAGERNGDAETVNEFIRELKQRKTETARTS